MKLTKNEIRIFNIWQFYDKNGFFPFEKVRIDITISGENYVKLKGKNKSKYIDSLIYLTIDFL